MGGVGNWSCTDLMGGTEAGWSGKSRQESTAFTKDIEQADVKSAAGEQRGVVPNKVALQPGWGQGAQGYVGLWAKRTVCALLCCAAGRGVLV